jgi:hypothetical protein
MMAGGFSGWGITGGVPGRNVERVYIRLIDTYQLIALHGNVRPRLSTRHFGNGEADRRLCAYAPCPAEPMDI